MRPTARSIQLLVAAALAIVSLAEGGCASFQLQRTPTRCEALCVRYYHPASVAVASGATSCVCYAPFLSGELTARATSATIEIVEAPAPPRGTVWVKR